MVKVCSRVSGGRPARSATPLKARRIPRDPNEEEMPDMPWDILWEIATERIARLDVTQDELDEVLDYAEFVKDRGRRHPHLRPR